MSQSIKAEPARDRLLKAAMALFYDRGIGGTGIDAIVERAGVAKKSLYNNFASKADLVAQYLDQRHAEWLNLYARRLAAAKDAREGILAVFDAYHDHAEHDYERGFRGCGLLNAAAELEVGDAGRDAVRRHKQEVESILAAHLSGLVAQDRAMRLAAHMAFLLEGAMVRAGLEGNGARVLLARDIARDMLDGL